MVALKIYKPGQGYWTRLLTAVATAVLLLFGIRWLWTQLEFRLEMLPLAAVILGVLAVFVIVLGWVMNRPRTVDFLIATDAEMRKVNWPSKREIYGSTWVVICGTILMAGLLFTFDFFFASFFQYIGVLR